MKKQLSKNQNAITKDLKKPKAVINRGGISIKGSLESLNALKLPLEFKDDVQQRKRTVNQLWPTVNHQGKKLPGIIVFKNLLGHVIDDLLETGESHISTGDKLGSFLGEFCKFLSPYVEYFFDAIASYEFYEGKNNKGKSFINCHVQLEYAIDDEEVSDDEADN